MGQTNLSPSLLQYQSRFYIGRHRELKKGARQVVLGFQLYGLTLTMTGQSFQTCQDLKQKIILQMDPYLLPWPFNSAAG
jgi:hypothetical protein